MAMLTACTNNDDDPVQPSSPQNEWTAEEKQFASQVIGAWCDFDEDEERVSSDYTIYDIQEDGVFDYWMFWISDDSEEPYDENVCHCSWKPVINIPDRWSNEGTFNGIEVRFHPKDQIVSPDQEAKDTLLFINLDSDEPIIVWTSDLDMALYYYNSLSPEEQAKLDGVAGTRGFGGWLLQRLINVGQHAVNVFKLIGQPVTMIARKIQGKNAVYASGLSDWMRDVYKDKDPRICDMSIPGTHDSFTYPGLLKDVNTWYKYPLVSAAMVRKVKTQALDIEEQWDAGIRCFDVRLDDITVIDTSLNIDKVLGIYHGFVYLGIFFDDGIDLIAEQLKAHKDETAIVILKFEGKENEKYYREVYNKVEQLRDDGLVVENPSPEMRLSQCRGKIIFIQRYGDNAYNLDVRATGWDKNSKLVFMNDPQKTAPLYVQDLYESDGDELSLDFINRKEKEMENCFEKSSKTGDNTWFFNHGSCYHGMSAFGWDWVKFLDMNYAEMASYINPWTADYLKDHQGKKTGVVVSDFSGADVLCDGNFLTRGIDVPINVVENNKYLQ
jgi:hypothetical protein